MAFNIKLLVYLAISIILAGLNFSCNALICYESSDDGSDPVVTESEDFKYCVVNLNTSHPFLNVAAMMGIGSENEDMTLYDQMFAQSDGTMYKVLSTCVFEQYDFGGGKPEALFRCFCNYDGCNKAVNINGFLRRLSHSK